MNSTWVGELSSNARGMLLMLFSTLIMVMMHGMVRHVGQDLPSTQVVFFRNLFALVAMVPILIRSGGFGQLKTRHPAMHLLRSVIGVFSSS